MDARYYNIYDIRSVEAQQRLIDLTSTSCTYNIIK